METVMTSWMRDAACAETGGDLWFPEANSPSTKFAKAICESCLVNDACLSYALEHKLFDGIWGGLTPNERKNLLRKGKRNGKK